MGGLHQMPLFRVQWIPQKRKWTDCKSQRGWKSSGEQGPLYQLSKARSDLTETEAANTGAKWLHQLLCVCIIGISLCFRGTLDCDNECDSDYCDYSWDPFLPVGWPWSTSLWEFLLHFIIFCFIMFGCYLIDACSFLMREKGSRSWGEIRRRVTGSSRRRGNYYQDILYEEMIYFQQKEKMKNCSRWYRWPK